MGFHAQKGPLSFMMCGIACHMLNCGREVKEDQPWTANTYLATFEPH